MKNQSTIRKNLIVAIIAMAIMTLTVTPTFADGNPYEEHDPTDTGLLSESFAQIASAGLGSFLLGSMFIIPSKLIKDSLEK